MVKKPRGCLLTGLRVLDLTLDGSLVCGRILAELGARVTKLKLPPVHNNFGHLWGDGIDAGAYLAFENAGGRVESLDPDTVSGQQKLERLAASNDCLIESFRPGYPDSIGLGFTSLSAINPRLIAVSITGFGQSGPRRDWVSCDLTIAALGGQMHITGKPGMPPLKLSGNQTEHLGVLFAINGLLLALHQRNQTGHGLHVDISLQESVAAALDHVLPRYFGDEVVVQRQGALSWNGVFDIFQCYDRHLLVSLPDDRGALVEWLASDGVALGLTGDKWCVPEHRIRDPGRVRSVIGRWAKSHKSGELFHRAQLMRLPWASVLRPGELFKNQQLGSRKFFKKHTAGDGSAKQVPRVLPFLVSCGPSVAEVKEHQKYSIIDAGRPLSGVRVLDFTWVLAGPYATRLLADFGAEVIKVQSRRVPGSEMANHTAYFKYWNRSKLGITLNMDHPEGIALARRLVRLSDVLIESFSPRVMDNWGLGWEVVRREKPDLVMVSMSAFGRSGPWRDYVAFGPTIHALSGLTWGTSYKHSEPVGPGFAYADHVAGLYASMAVMSALENRRRTGRGAFVDLSQFEAMCVLTDTDRNRSVIAAPSGVYRCRGDDDWCAISVFGHDEWCRLCQVMGKSSLLDEPGFATKKLRLKNHARLDRIIDEWTGGLTAGEVMTRLQNAGVCAGVVQSARDLATDEQLRARRFIVKLADSAGGGLVMDGTPIRLSDSRAFCAHAATETGEHNEYVFCDLLGMSRKELAGYVERGVIY